MWTIAPLQVRQGHVPDRSHKIDQVTAGAAVGAYVRCCAKRGPLDIVVRCAVARFHFFVHVMRNRGGEIAVHSIPGAMYTRHGVDDAA